MRLPTSIALLALLAGAGCKKPEPAGPQVEHAWVRLSPLAGHPAAGYFELYAGKSADRLVAVMSPKAQAVQMHQTMAGTMTGAQVPDLAPAMTSMRPVTSIAMPPDSVTSFQPGGYHLMLMGIDPSVRRGTAIDLRFTLASGRTLDAKAQVVSAGDPAPVASEGG